MTAAKKAPKTRLVSVTLLPGAALRTGRAMGNKLILEKVPSLRRARNPAFCCYDDRGSVHYIPLSSVLTWEEAPEEEEEGPAEE